MKYREDLHIILGLEMDKPYFRYGNAVKFYDSQAENILINPHEAIQQNHGTY